MSTRQTGNKHEEAWVALGLCRRSYEVSNYGRVRRAKWVDSRGKQRDVFPVSTFVNRYNGYVYCGLGRKQYRVHRLVMLAFVGPRPDGMVINHINRDKTDNRLCNLEYVTQRENLQHSVRAIGNWSRRPKKLTREAVTEIRAATSGIVALADRFGVSYQTIKMVRSGRTWRGA